MSASAWRGKPGSFTRSACESEFARDRAVPGRELPEFARDLGREGHPSLRRERARGVARGRLQVDVGALHGLPSHGSPFATSKGAFSAQ